MSHPWLPAEALTGPEIRLPIQRAVDGWCAAWFSGRVSLAIQKVDAKGEPALDGGRTARIGRPGGPAGSVMISDRSMSRFRARALHSSEAGRPGGGREAALLDGFAERMVKDLAERIEAEFQIEPSSPVVGPTGETASGEGPLLCAYLAGADSSESAWIALPLSEAVAIKKNGLPKPRRRDALASLRSAFASSSVILQARLGGARLSIGDLRGLQLGDVIILDQGLEAPAEIVAGPQNLPVGRARLKDADPITLALES